MWVFGLLRCVVLVGLGFCLVGLAFSFGLVVGLKFVVFSGFVVLMFVNFGVLVIGIWWLLWVGGLVWVG